MNAMAHKTEPRALWAASIAVVIWSSAYAAITYGLRSFTPGELTFLRFAVASLVFAVPVALGYIKLPPRQDWLVLAGLALIGHVGYQLCLMYSMTRISAGAAAVAIAMVPSVTAVIAVLRLHERLSLRAVIGLAIAFLGTLLVVIGRGHEIRFEPLALLVFVSVLCSSFYFVFQKPLLARTTSLGFTAASMFVATLALTPLAVHLPAKLALVPAPQLVSALYLGLLPTVMGFLLWSWALARAPASKVTSFINLGPVSGIAIAYFWVDEIPGWLTLVGGTLAILGVVLATAQPEGRLARLWTRRPVPAPEVCG